MPGFCKALVALLATTVGSSAALAQWTNNPASPLVIGDPTSDGPIVVPIPDGGCYVAWQGGVGGVPYNSVHLQHLDAAGQELWGHNGIVAVVGNSSFSQVSEFDLAIASDGNALITTSIQMTDAANPTIHQATVQKFAAADGHKMWGTGGGDVAVTTGVSQISWVHSCSTPDAGCIVGYTFTNGSTVLMRFMRLSAAGTPVWNLPGTQVFIQGSFLNLISMKSGGADGSFIAFWGKDSTTLQSQKFTGGAGATPGTVFSGWGTAANPITIDAGGMTGFNFYQAIMLSDGNGGAIYGWSSFASGSSACSTGLLQHVLSSGTIKFTPAVNNVGAGACGGANGRGRYSGRPAFRQDPGSSPPTYTYYLASEQGPSSSGSVTSAMVQKFDDMGNRMWSDSGVVVIPEVNSGPNWIHPVATSDGGCICAGDYNVGQLYGSNAVYAAKVVDDPSSFGYGMVAWRKVINTDIGNSKGRLKAVPVAGTDDAMVVHTSNNSLDAIRVNGTTGAPGLEPIAPTLDVDVPDAIVACDGDTITISVQASGTPPIIYGWQRHYAYNVSGNPDAAWGLSDGDSSSACRIPSDGTTYSGTGTATLTIHNIHANNPSATCPDSDPTLNQYRCVIYSPGSPSGGAIISSWAHVTVGSGACCSNDGSGTCTSACNSTACGQSGGTYQGDFSTCSPNPCGGACCGATTCTQTGPTTCSGSFLGIGSSCSPLPCNGSCCDNSIGACSVTASSGCFTGSTFTAFGSCNPNVCPQPGACCLNSNGSCTIAVPSTCTSNSGHTFIGQGTTCDNDPCAPGGACCSNLDGSYCVVLSQTTCTGISSRRWQGADTVCSPSPCPQLGACCSISTGGCTLIAQPGCGAGNTFQQADATCNPNPCPQSGACCDASTGACSAVAQSNQCGGQFFGGASCGSSPCPAPIACCQGTSCFTSLPNFCGSPAPAGATSCTPSPCAATAGICCRGATCIVQYTSSSACSASVAGALAGSIYAASGTCNAANNFRTPCCYADYNKVNGVGVPDIFDFLNDWFAGRKFAIVAGDGVNGALNVQNIFDFLNDWFAGGC